MVLPHVCAQDSPSGQVASVSGFVKDANKSPVAAATIRLRSKNGLAGIAVSDHDGAYRLSAIPPGEYTLDAEKPGFVSLAAVPLHLRAGEVRKQDLGFELKPNLGDAKPGAASKITPPQFFDEPKFTVAGVTDVWHYGGHGSDPALRDSESLAKSAAGLSAAEAPNASPSPAPASGKSEAGLKESPDSSFDANFSRGRNLAQEREYRQALPFLEKASALVSQNISPSDQAALHELLGIVQEQVGNPLAAVREYESAAALDPTETNLFGWGAELLLHGAFEPAIEVFNDGMKRFPASIRMRLGLSVAWYAQGSQDEAARILCAASDLNPQDFDPYIFMGRMQAAAPKPPACFADRLARFARLQPQNAMANYFQAVSLWKSRKNADDEQTFGQAQALLQKSIQLEPGLAAAYLQLGLMEDEESKDQQAVADFQKSIALDPQTDEAHYRLAQIYARTGEKKRAQEELDAYRKIQAQQAGEAERGRHQMPQFVYTLKEPAAQAAH